MQTKLFLFLFSLTIYSTTVAQKKVFFKNLSIESGLTSNAISKVLEDDMGNIWIGSREGLHKYYGGTLQSILPNQAQEEFMFSCTIWDMIDDHMGSVWIGTSKGLFRYSLEFDSLMYYQSGLDLEVNLLDNSVAKVSLMDDRHLVLRYHSGAISVLNFETNKLVGHYASKKYDDPAVQFKPFLKGIMYFDQYEKSVFISASNIPLIKVDSTGWTEYHSVTFPDDHNNLVVSEGIAYYGRHSLFSFEIDKLPNVQPKRIHLYDDSLNLQDFKPQGDLLWFSSSKYGLFAYNLKTKQIEKEYNSTHYPSIIDNEINTFFFKKDHIIALSKRGYLYLIYPEEDKVYRFEHDPYDPSSLPEFGEGFMSFLSDQIGTNWIATDQNGVIYFNEERAKFNTLIKMPDDKTSLKGSLIRGIYGDADHRLIGNKRGIHIIDQKDNSYTYLPSKDPINAIAKDDDGVFWIGASLIDKYTLNEDGVLEKVGHYIPDYGETTALPGWFVTKIMKDSKGSMWVATSNGIGKFIGERPDGTPIFKQYKTTPGKDGGLPGGLVWDIYEGKDGVFWITTVSGFGRLDTKTGYCTTYKSSSDPNSLYSDNTKSIVEASNGLVWVSMEGGGLCRFDPKNNTFKNYSTVDGLPSNTVYGIIEDDEGMLWLSTLNGISRLDPVKEKFDNYSVADGLQGRSFNMLGFFKDETTGNLYFGGENGVSFFNPKEIGKSDFIPALNITTLKINDERLYGGKTIDGEVILSSAIWNTNELELRYDHNQLYFEFSTQDYIGVDNIQYEYMLVGFDNVWKRTTNKKNYAEYSNLLPGDYAFKVRSTNADGIWNTKEKTMLITIVPPFWETLWFKFLIGLLVILGSMTFYKVRLRNLKQAKVKLEQEVAHRTEELRMQAEELEASNDQLEEQNRVITAFNSDLEQKQEEITQLAQNLQEVNKEISSKNERLTDSINYAQTIQRAVLPKHREFETTFEDHFIIYKAKDIVSGDFYWLSEIEDKVFLAVVDCTGHGVPGAFMSLIGSTLLTRIVKELKIFDTSEILHRLHTEIQKALKQKDAENSDGMDLSLCCLERDEAGHFNKIYFTGAKNSAYIVSEENTEVEKIKADNISIGGIWRKEKNFSVQSKDVKRGDKMYLFTDGFADQCNPERVRFSSLRLLTKIQEIHALPLKEQGALLEEELLKFQLSADQRDDITVMGIKI